MNKTRSTTGSPPEVAEPNSALLPGLGAFGWGALRRRAFRRRTFQAEQDGGLEALPRVSPP